MSSRGNRRVLGPQRNTGNDRDEDLFLFQDIQKRDKERTSSLLQAVPDEFESNSGNYPFYRMSSGKKGFGLEFLTGSDKNDYDWLKTPPATPLFASLEMEVVAPELAVQKELPILQPLSRVRELPILQPLSRFSGNSDAPKAARPKTPTPKPKIPSRSVTPSSRRSVPSTTESSNQKRTPVLNQKATPQSSISDTTKRLNVSSVAIKSSSPRENDCASIPFTQSKPIVKDSNSRPKSRGVSPLVRSTIPATISGFSDETPPNLKTDRPLSATRGRPSYPSMSLNQPKQEPINPRRQSCSPSMSRGRKPDLKQEAGGSDPTTIKMRTQGGNGSLIFGSRMVEKVMNARKLGGEEREAQKHKVGPLANDNSGFGRMMSKSSLDMALRHMEVNQDATKVRRANPTKNCTTISTHSSWESNAQTIQAPAGRTQESWKRKETRKFPTKEERNNNCGLC